MLKGIRRTARRAMKAIRKVFRPNEIAAGGPLDSTAHTGRNVAHWANAQDFYADELASASNRATARSRCRLEYANSGYIKNAVRAFKTHVVGAAGPVLKLTPAKSHPRAPQITDDEKELIEWEFYYWCQQADIVEKLKRMVGALVYDGESFLMAVHDPWIEDGSELNYQEIEAKRVSQSFYSNTKVNEIDGIEYDGLHACMYRVLRKNLNPDLPAEYQHDQIPAEGMIHLANLDFVDQHRGLPMLQCVLQMQADVRNWVIYTLAAAAHAARGGSGFIKSQNSFNPEKVDRKFDIQGAYMHSEPGVSKLLPPGWEPYIPDVKFPTNNFGEFNKMLNGEIAAGIGVPGGIMMADTSDYNFSSYKGERQNYWTYIADIQNLLNRRVLDVLFHQWFECRASYDPDFQRIFDRCKGKLHYLAREWKYAKPLSVDPQKDVAAWKELLEMGCISRRMICEELGFDHDDVLNDLENEINDPRILTIIKLAMNKGNENLNNDLKTEDVAAAFGFNEKPGEYPAPKTVASPADIPPTLSPLAAAECLGVSLKQLNTWRKSGGLEYYRLADGVRYGLTELAAWAKKGGGAA